MNNLFEEGTIVEIHSLGPSYGDQTFYGQIVGVTHDEIFPNFCHYIIQLFPCSKRDLNSKYSCITMPNACVRKIL